MLSGATGRDTWQGKLPPGTEWNEEAGDLAGVVSLLAASRSEPEACAALEAAARTVAADLRRALPHCPIRGYIGFGPSYAAAYHEIDRARRMGAAVVDAPAAPAEVILAALCENCGQAAAVRQDPDDDGNLRRVCGECAGRRHRDAAGRTTGSGVAVPKAEAVLHDALVKLGHAGPRFPDNSKELAAAAVHETGGAHTQVALIYADGNRVGAFLAKAATAASTLGRPEKEEIVTAIGDATLAALAATVQELFGGRGVLPIIPHMADGDDMMVSVAAPDAWPFARRLLSEFTTQLAARTADWPAEVGGRPTLSAGVLFHHHTHPFSDAVQLAKGRLAAAKESVEGRVSTVDFLDLTADGDTSPNRRAMTLPDLDSRVPLLDRTARIPAAQRATLLGLCREVSEPDELDGAQEEQHSAAGRRPETAAEALARRLVELDATPLLQAIGLGPSASVEQARERLAGRRSAERDELRALLDLARWWPVPTAQAAGTAGAAR